jgi:trans-aconitate methyltransferase
MAAQEWNAQQYIQTAGFVPRMGEYLLDLLAPQTGERVLDVGCGEGSLTAKIAARGADVVGVDADENMVQAARAAGLDARRMDARDMPFRAEFDAAFSNAALHWMKPMPPVIAAIARALKPGGRFVGEMGGFGNVESVHVALLDALQRRGIHSASYDPWYFPSPQAFRLLLEEAGLTVETAELFPRPTNLPKGQNVTDWLNVFGKPFLKPLRAEEQDDFLKEVAAQIRLPMEGGQYVLDYVRLRFKAVK